MGKMAIITPFGLFEFLRMPFGLKNAAQTFQCLMDAVVKYLDFVFIYLDDILIASRKCDEHEAHLRTFFARLVDKLHHTTAYHPQSNGLVERFHNYLKASHDQVLPWVLLGIRTAPKEDLQASAVEIVYGTPLSLSGEFFGPDPDITATDKNLLADLGRRLASLAPPPTACHGTQPFQLPKELNSAQFIFMWRGPQAASLQ
ncbi:uncharacterized protein [Narcine bancroftii]|uniref:uncharacterized protein isoform X2 n=1 Tax=Narcine bancroftii TaxID=1343680 RepID=UPI003831A281